MKLIGFIRGGYFLAAMVVLMPLTLAQEKADFLQNLNELRDPFIPQLPPPKVVQVLQPEKQKPTIIPTERTIQPIYKTTDPDPVNTVPVIPAIQTNAFVVKGLIWNTDMPQAIINDKILKVGDFINGVKIVAIQSKGVELSNSGINVLVNVTDKQKKIDQ